jgi:uncharacterized protein (TIGR02266 family)
MRLRPAAVPSVDPIPASADGGLLEREQAALEAERAISVEAEALARAMAQLSAEVQTLADRAGRLQQAGHPQGEWLLARFHTHRLESPDLSAPSSQALAARNHALAARSRAVDMARVLLQASASAIEEHRGGLARDAGELERLEAAAEESRADEARRAEAERREAEQARARRESQAAADRARNAAAARGPSMPVVAGKGPPEPASPAPAAPARPRAPGQPLGKLSAPGAVNSGRNGTRIPVQTQVDLSSDSNVFTGFSTNLSEGGVFVATVNLLPVGTPVDLTLTLPGKTRIAVKGEVRWTREIDDRVPDVFPGVGVRFVELGPEASEALHRFVKEREPLFYPD